MFRGLRFGSGSEIQLGGARYKVESLSAQWVWLMSADGDKIRAGLWETLRSPSFRVVDADAPDVQALVTPLSSLSKQELARLMSLAGAINEIETGYRSGDPQDARPGEPRPEFDLATTTKEQRRKVAEKETGRSVGTLRRLAKRYDTDGLVGLMDRRMLRSPRDPLTGIDERLREEIRRLALAQTFESTITRKRFRHEIERNCARAYGDGVVPIPGRRRFQAVIDEITRGMGVFGTAKLRRETAARPTGAYRHPVAVAAGESVIIDSTRLDIIVVDAETMTRHPVDLFVAIDRATRRCVGKLLTPVGANQVEAVMLLADILMPLRMRPDWGGVDDGRFCGVPREVVVSLIPGRMSGAEIADGALVSPQSITTDNAWIYDSHTFREGCRKLGITVVRARQLTPTDKAITERFFGSLTRDLLVGLPGYKGATVIDRGSDVESSAFLFTTELDAKIDEYLARVYHPRPQDGLRLPHIPTRPLSPNEMYDELLEINGCIYVPPSPNFYFELLPVVWRTIQPYGVEVHGLVYGDDPDDPEKSVVTDLRYRKSPYGGVHRGKWPISYDPRDKSRVYIQDPVTAEWCVLGWIHAVGPDRPFTDALLGAAKRIALLEMGNQRPSRDHYARVLNQLIDDAQDAAAAGRASRQQLRDRMRTKQAAKDAPTSAPEELGEEIADALDEAKHAPSDRVDVPDGSQPNGQTPDDRQQREVRPFPPAWSDE